METQSVHLLYIGCDMAMAAAMLRVVTHYPGWELMVADTVTAAIDACTEHHFDLVLMGAGLHENMEQQVTTELGARYPWLPVIQHYGGGSGLLYSTVQFIMGQRE